MKSIKEHGLPKSDNTYLIRCPHYDSKDFEAYLDDNNDWWDCRVPANGLGFIFYEVTHYEPIDLLENIENIENEQD